MVGIVISKMRGVNLRSRRATALRCLQVARRMELRRTWCINPTLGQQRLYSKVLITALYLTNQNESRFIQVIIEKTPHLRSRLGLKIDKLAGCTE